MRAVVTRVKSASVAIAGEIVGQIGQGFLILLGVAPDDTGAQCKKLAEKALGLRVFCDENDKMNLSLLDIKGEALVISNFTLCGDCKKGRRPFFGDAALPAEAQPLYDYFCTKLSECGVKKVDKGIFGADMKVRLLNDGPVTISINSKELSHK